MSQQKETVKSTIKEVEVVVDLFYQQKKKEALEKFNTVIGNMMNSIDILFTYKAEHDGFELDENKLTNILKEAMNALQDGDEVLLADILQYDYMEYMEELVSTMD